MRRPAGPTQPRPPRLNQTRVRTRAPPPKSTTRNHIGPSESTIRRPSEARSPAALPRGYGRYKTLAPAPSSTRRPPPNPVPPSRASDPAVALGGAKTPMSPSPHSRPPPASGVCQGVADRETHGYRQQPERRGSMPARMAERYGFSLSAMSARQHPTIQPADRALHRNEAAQDFACCLAQTASASRCSCTFANAATICSMSAREPRNVLCSSQSPCSRQMRSLLGQWVFR